MSIVEQEGHGANLPAPAKRRGNDQDASTSERFSNWELEGMPAEKVEEAERIKAKVAARPLRPVANAKLVDGKLIVGLGNPDTPGSDVLNSIRVYGALGSSSNQFVGATLNRIALTLRFSADDPGTSEKIGAALALVAAVEPQNELEATMAVQMVAANEAALAFFDRSRSAEFIEHAAAYSNMANKAMRSFALHAEAINKLRRNGEQVVKHVTVNEGGQAVIANRVTAGGRGQ